MPKLMQILNNFRTSCKGNVVIIIAIVMMASASLSFYLLQHSIMSNKEKAKITVQRMEEIRSRIQFYTDDMGNFFPCPAKIIGANESDGDFGDAVANCTTLINPQLTAAGLIYSATTPQILVGAVPVRELGLANDYAFDGWGRYMRYMLVETGTTYFTVTNLDGGTDNMTSHEFEGVDMENLSLAIISHGADGDGAYKRNGVLNSACSVVDNADGENCDDDAALIYDRWNTDEDIDYDDIVTGWDSAVTPPACSIPDPGWCAIVGGLYGWMNVAPAIWDCDTGTCDGAMDANEWCSTYVDIGVGYWDGSGCASP